jgi:hypothetical protein
LIATFRVHDLLPTDWRLEVLTAAAHEATPFKRVGPTETAPDSAGLSYSVIEYPLVRRRLPWMVGLHTHLADRAGEALGVALTPSRHPQCAINVNVIEGRGGAYEMHLDTMPYTGVLFIEKCAGGDFLHGSRDPDLCRRISPDAGLFVVGKLSEIWHGVAPITRGVRVSVPFGFEPHGTPRRAPYNPGGFIPSAKEAS